MNQEVKMALHPINIPEKLKMKVWVVLISCAEVQYSYRADEDGLLSVDKSG